MNAHLIKMKSLSRSWLVILAVCLFALTAVLYKTITPASAQGGCTTPDTSLGTGDFRLSIAETGDYKIWFRTASPTAEGRFMLKINEGCHSEVKADNQATDTLAWHNLYADNSEIEATLNAGLNRFEMVGQTEGLEIDQVIVTLDGCTPVNTGDNCRITGEEPPEVVIIDPTASTVLRGDVDMHAVVTDQDVALEVNFYIDDELYSSADKNGMAEWYVQFQASDFANGEHKLRVEATDSSGNRGSSETTFRLEVPSDPEEETPPEVPIVDGDQQNVRLLPTDDTFARADKPSTPNTNSTLHTDAKPNKVIYLKYAIPDNFKIEKAALSLFAITNASDGGSIYSTQTGWSEDSLTWNNRPNLNENSAVEIGGIKANTWKEVDVKSVASINDGYISLAIRSDSDELARYNSKEKSDGETGPYLVLTGVAEASDEPSDPGTEPDPTPPQDDDSATNPGDTPATPNPQSKNYTITVSEDSFVREDQPNATAKTNTLHIDTKPQKIIYMKFDVDDVVNKSIESVKLRAYSIEGGDSGGSIHQVNDSSWTEGSLNWNNRPVYQAGSLAEFGKVETDQWYEIDLSSLDIPANGVVTLAIVADKDDRIRYQSKDKEDGNYAAELLIRAH